MKKIQEKYDENYLKYIIIGARLCQKIWSQVYRSVRKVGEKFQKQVYPKKTKVR